VASRVLGLAVDMIHISETATNVSANATLTAGSTGSDLYGPAVLVCYLALLLYEYISATNLPQLPVVDTFDFTR